MTETSPGTAGTGNDARDVVIIVPAHDAAPYLDRTLPALLEASGGAEVVVVDDCSSDDSARIAAGYGVRVERLGTRGGAAAARNRGVRESRGSVIVFVDADVLVHPSSISNLVDRLLATRADAVFGSYDDDPPASGFFSQYANLRHHYYHQRTREGARTFWAGFGAMRRAAFERADGFDPAFAGVEDVALGYRLVARGGRIVSEPAIRVTHLKHWSLRKLLRTDVFMRALPWSRLILSGAGQPTLNVDWPERLRAAVALLLATGAVTSLTGFPGWEAATVPALMAIAANARLGGFFARRRGPWFAVRAIAWHQFYYLYASATFAAAWVESMTTRRRKTEDRASA